MSPCPQKVLFLLPRFSILQCRWSILSPPPPVVYPYPILKEVGPKKVVYGGVGLSSGMASRQEQRTLFLGRGGNRKYNPATADDDAKPFESVWNGLFCSLVSTMIERQTQQMG